MNNESQPTASIDPTTGQPLAIPVAPPAPETKTLLAPVWHTVLIVIFMLLNSYFTAKMAGQASKGSAAASEKVRILQYIFTICLELFLLLLVWIGLRLKRTRIRELIGGRWNSVEDFLIDIGIAAGFWIASAAILAGLAFLLGLAKGPQVEEAKKLADLLAPRSAAGLVTWILLSTTAGFVEEIIFRGYLQRQIAVISGNVWVGLIGSALIFGGGHGYEGTRRMIIIAVYGALFGLLAHYRKSLRPGMMAHAWHDAFQGVLLHFVVTKGSFPIR